MRVPSAYDRSSQQAEPAMTPMIDVVFLLLIFFVWTASFQAVEKLLPSELTAESSVGRGTRELAEQDFERIVIRITGDPEQVQWTLNGQPLADREKLQSRLKDLAAARSDLPVVIDPDPVVLLDFVIATYDDARAAGLANIQFTTSAP